MTARPALMWTRCAGQPELRAGGPGERLRVRLARGAHGAIVEEIER